MSETLYNSDILRLATSIPHHARLTHPHATSERRSPICGSRIIVDVTLDGRYRIATVGLEVRACALGQASASLMAAHCHGRSLGELDDARNALAAFLAGSRDEPGEWPGLELFRPARAHRARHASILLAFEAVAEATERASTARAA